MGSTNASDLRGLVFTAGPFTQASRASNAAAATQFGVWTAPHKCRITAVRWIPTEGDQTAHATNNHKVSILDAGAAGTGTAVLASYRFTASVASNASGSIPTTGTTELDAGDIVVAAFSTQATASSVGKLFAANFFFDYELR